MSDRLYKVTHADGRLYHGIGRWNLPKNGQPGEWMPPILGPLVACRNGYHLCERDTLIYWLGEAIHEVEYRGEMIRPAQDKILVREVRIVHTLSTWTERTARLLAADCAERVLPLFEAERPNDDRPRTAIAVARCFARGTATEQQLTAAGAAAGAASRAAEAAARAAGDAAWAAEAAARAAGDAAWAAGAAAGAASRAAEAAERKWQTDRLWFYLDGGGA